MSKQMPSRPHLRRELALYRYSTALERGDFATVAAVLQQAEHDPVLARLLAAWDQHLLSEHQGVVGLADPAAVRQMLAQFIAPSPPTSASNGHLSTTPALPESASPNQPPSLADSVPPQPLASLGSSSTARPDPFVQAVQDATPPRPQPSFPPRMLHRTRQPGRISWMAALLALAAIVVLFALLFRTLAFSQTAHPSLPVTATPSSPPLPFVHGTTAYLMDAGTGQVLYHDQVHQVALPIASTTEIMTALVAIEQGGDLLSSVPITQEELGEVPEGASVAFLQIGDDNITLRYLLYALLLPSGSDAAIVIAHAVAGSTEQFVGRMNTKARALGLTDTHFTSPDGVEPTNTSSAADLVKLTQYAMKNTTFATIVGTHHFELPAQTHRHAYSWENTNQLLGTYTGANGVKVGSSNEAGYCVVFSATRNGHQLIGAELGAPTANLLYADGTELLNWGFAKSRS